ATALAHPTVHRLLTSLISEGVVEQRAHTRRYAAAQHMYLAAERPPGSPLLGAAMTHLKDAAEHLGDTVFLTLRDRLETVCVARVLGSYPIQVLTLDVGVRRPLGVSSSGIAFLATLGHDAARRIVLRNRRHLPGYDMSPADAYAAIERARALGYALRERGLVPGTKAVSFALGKPRGGGAQAAL